MKWAAALPAFGAMAAESEVPSRQN